MAERHSPKERAGENRTGRRRWLRWVVAGVGLALIALAAADALGAFKRTPYTAVPHGSHDHYVPDECEDARTGDFPTRPPREGERITCNGNVISE